MKYILYIIAVFLIIFWAIGFFVYSLGAIIHLLLVAGVVTILYKSVQSGPSGKTNSSQKTSNRQSTPPR
ncbi:MAG: lmo0937 family membrane protein [Balneolaceae bacterium]